MFYAYRQTVGEKMAAPESVIEIGSTGVRLLVAEVTQDR